MDVVPSYGLEVTVKLLYGIPTGTFARFGDEMVKDLLLHFLQAGCHPAFHFRCQQGGDADKGVEKRSLFEHKVISEIRSDIVSHKYFEGGGTEGCFEIGDDFHAKEFIEKLSLISWKAAVFFKSAIIPAQVVLTLFYTYDYGRGHTLETAVEFGNCNYLVKQVFAVEHNNKRVFLIRGIIFREIIFHIPAFLQFKRFEDLLFYLGKEPAAHKEGKHQG